MKELNLSDKIVEDGDFVIGTKVVSVRDVKEAIRLLKEVLKSYEKNTGLSELHREHLEIEINKIFGDELTK